MTLKKLSHTAFYVTDMEKALVFYRDGLGMKECFHISYGEVAQWHFKEHPEAAEAIKQKGGDISAMISAKMEEPWLIYLEIAPLQFLELFSSEDGMENGVSKERRIGYDHLSLEVEDIREAAAELETKGIRSLAGISLGLDHSWQCWYADPDGNKIELMQFTPESLQVTSVRR
jgi:catechol 2,3-dioxygenase-like lactoylglutathione lyase family enzyme